MKIAALQMDIAWEDRRANYWKVREFALKAKDMGADLLVLPEMFATGFSMNPKVTAEGIDGETATFIRALAQKNQLAVLGGFVLFGKEGRGRNSALAVDKNGNDLSVYVKSYLISLLDEDKHHEHGDGPKPFELNGTTCACFICYDLRFPELFRMAAQQCDVFFIIASWPEVRQPHWDPLLLARAIENQLYIVGVNRIGIGGGLNFVGGTVVYHPSGKKLAYGSDKQGLVIADIDPKEVKNIRAQMPFLKDCRFLKQG